MTRKPYIPFSDEQKLEANSTDLVEFLRSRGQELKREGRDYRWLGHPGLTVSGNVWYDHYEELGGYPVKFLQKYFDLGYVEAMTELLGGSRMLTPAPYQAREKQERKEFVLPHPAADLRHVYAYLMKQRFIGRNVIDHFVAAKSLYEDERHNAVFVGLDEHGAAKSAHKKGTLSEVSYRANVAGSDVRYGFGHTGPGEKLFVFEAPIDLLSYLTLYPDGWRKQSYVALDGVSEHPMLQALAQRPNPGEICLCLDHDPAGIEACGRLADILREKGYQQVYRLLPDMKDWNEMLRARNGAAALPAAEHPKVESMRELCASLAAEQPDSMQQYKKLFSLCERYLQSHDPALLYPAAKQALFCAQDQYEKAGKQVSARQIAGYLHDSYRPHLDHIGASARESQIRGALAGMKLRMSPSGVYTERQRVELARGLLQVGQLCLTAQIFLSQEPEQKQSIAM